MLYVPSESISLALFTKSGAFHLWIAETFLSIIRIITSTVLFTSRGFRFCWGSCTISWRQNDSEHKTFGKQLCQVELATLNIQSTTKKLQNSITISYCISNYLQNVQKVWNHWEFYLLFMLYALCVHPDTLRIFSAALPCCADFAQHIGIDSSITVFNYLPKVTNISD
jgi:hypothetical protein